MPSKALSGSNAVSEIDARFRQAVADGERGHALGLLRQLEILSKGATSHEAAAVYLMAIGHLALHGGIHSQTQRQDWASEVSGVAEAWFNATLEAFCDVAEGARQAAMHALMHAAARSGHLDLALQIRRQDDQGNARCAARWASAGIDSSPGTHAFYPSAYGSAQLIAYLVTHGRFSDVPSLLDSLAHLTASCGGADQEVRDAFGEEEAAALAIILASTAPADLQARCEARRESLISWAVPADYWPRTRTALAPCRLGRKSAPDAL